VREHGECNGRSIKGVVKENSSPSAGGREGFRDDQPLSAMRDAWFWGCLFLLSGSILWSRRRHSDSETGQALRLYGVNHGSI
jgi:hypothetical protein